MLLHLIILGLLGLYILGASVLIFAIKFKKIETKKYKIKYLLYFSLVFCVAGAIFALYNSYLYWHTKEFYCTTPFGAVIFSTAKFQYIDIGMVSIATIFTGVIFWTLHLRRTSLLSLMLAGIISFTSIVSIDKFENEWNTREEEFCSTLEQIKETQNRQIGLLFGIGLLWGAFKYKELQDK